MATAEETTLKKEILRLSTRTDKKSDTPCKYELRMDETFFDRTNKVRKLELGGEGVSGADEKVIMILGETGCGKTTLINFMANYIFGVEFGDNFRFKIAVDSVEKDSQKKGIQSSSQTQWVTSYTFHHCEGMKQPFTFTLVDTPGFGDTGGVKNDKKIVERIREFFLSPGGVDHLDAVGFVVQAGVTRLTPSHRYVFDSILALFGKDIGDNICMLITFADLNTAPVLTTLAEAEIKYSFDVKFNNSSVFAKFKDEENDEDACDFNEFNEKFWKRGVRSMDALFQHLLQLTPKSLTLTKDVLSERKRLQACLIAINDAISSGLNKLNQLENEIEVIKNHQNDIDRNRNFEYKVKEERAKHKLTPTGTFVTNCFRCNRTCHYPCRIADDDEKARCSAMENGNCTVCEPACSWSEHRNMAYRIVKRIKTVTKTAEDLKNRFRDAKGKFLSAKGIAQSVYEEYLETKVRVMGLVIDSKECLQRLKKIALKPDPLNEIDYIDQLIEAEKTNKTDGYADRIEQLSDIRKLAVHTEKLKKDELMSELCKFEDRVCNKYPNLLKIPKP